MTLPVLWICGPPGSGKSTVGWQVRARLAADGAAIAYVDVDQLGICFPEPDDDPSRTRLQARVLSRLIEGFAAEGSCGVVVSGVTDAHHGPHADLVAATSVTVVRLTADDESLRARLTGRGAAEMVDGALLEAKTLAGSAFADRVVDTTGVDVPDVVDRVLAQVGAWPHDAAPCNHRPGPDPSPIDSPDDLAGERPGADVDPPTDAPAGHVLFLSGATGVGKSTIGFPVFLQSLGAGVPSAYLDLDQLSFVAPASAPASGRLTARHAAAAWAQFRAVGAQRLVVVGTVDDAAALAVYEAAFAPAAVILVRLHVDAPEHVARVLSRGAGGSWAQPGDPLHGLSPTRLHEVADRAVRDAAAREAIAPGAVVDTTGRAAWDVATQLAARWP